MSYGEINYCLKMGKGYLSLSRFFVLLNIDGLVLEAFIGSFNDDFLHSFLIEIQSLR